VKPAGAHLPYARHVDGATIETRDGLLLQVIRLDGLLFETADTDELNYRAALRDAMLQTIASSRFAIYHHVIRRKAEVTLETPYPDSFSAHLDSRWRGKLAGRQMYVNELFLTIVRRPLQGRFGALDRLRTLFAFGETERRADFASECRALDNAVQALMATLGAYGPRLLAIQQDGRTEVSLRAAGIPLCLFNGEMRPMVPAWRSGPSPALPPRQLWRGSF
jgi:type IV secretion system protein VirB4